MFEKPKNIMLMLLALIAATILAGCPQAADPTGSINPAPGEPYGGSGSSVIAATPLPVFDINNLDAHPVSWWNDQGEFPNWPNIFQKANGEIISTKEQWATDRRAEVKKILEYYYCGSYPPQPTNITVSGPGTSAAAGQTIGGDSLTITVTSPVAGTNITKSFSLGSLTIPAIGPNGQPPSATNKIPLVLLLGVSPTIFNQCGYATIDFRANTDALTGIVDDIFAYPSTDLDRPSALVREAWKAARILDAFEVIARDHNGVIDPAKFVVSGMSRWGKGALYIGAFAESMSGKRIAVSNPVSSGTSGAAPDRFLSQAWKKNNNNKLTYFYKMLDNYGGTPLVQIARENLGGTNANRTNAGFETGTQARIEPVGGAERWWGLRFQDFTDIHTEWICNYQSPTDPPNETRHHGYAGTAPFDAHFLTSLVAPQGLLLHDGWDSYWTNAEGMYVNYLATREVYEFIEKPQNIGVRIYKIEHSQPTREFYDLVDYANYYFNREQGTNYIRTSNTVQYPIPALEAFLDADPLFNGGTLADWFDPKAQDPEGRPDYLKLNWAAPNKPAGSSVADVVKTFMDEHQELYPHYYQ
jgi:hypothetical protein